LLLEESPLNSAQRWLWVLSTGGTLLDGFVLFALGVAMPLIIPEFHITPDVVGLIGSALVLGAAAGGGDHASVTENRKRAELAAISGKRRTGRAAVFRLTFSRHPTVRTG
jgi:hypothetical protein